MAEMKGSRTERNLLKAFAGESQARNRYTYFAKTADKEGFKQIAAIFLETADQEMTHAKRFFQKLKGGMVEITAMYPAGVIGTTAENLEAAAGGEHEEWSLLYPEFANIAREEGFPDVGALFDLVSKAEQTHERRYRALLKNLQTGKAFKRDQPVKWYCRKCGYIHEGPEAPKTCPCCGEKQEYFQVHCECW